MELQEYIELYCKEKDEKYFLWFLHYYENTLNTKVMGWVQNYAMPGHFQDMKQAFIALHPIVLGKPRFSPLLKKLFQFFFEPVHSSVNSLFSSVEP